jgi:hypothetical protein
MFEREFIHGIARTPFLCYKVTKVTEVFRNPQSYQKSQKGQNLRGRDDKRPRSKSSLEKAGFEKKGSPQRVSFPP